MNRDLLNAADLLVALYYRDQQANPLAGSLDFDDSFAGFVSRVVDTATPLVDTLLADGDAPDLSSCLADFCETEQGSYERAGDWTAANCWASAAHALWES